MQLVLSMNLRAFQTHYRVPHGALAQHMRRWLSLAGYVVLALFTSASFAAPAVAQGREYSRRVELPPLRWTRTEFSRFLEKASQLASESEQGVPLDAAEQEVLNREASGGGGQAPGFSWHSESLELKDGEYAIVIQSSDLDSVRARLPDVIRSASYSWRSLRNRAVPIASLSANFYDFSRTIQVSGASPDQVDAVCAALRDFCLKRGAPLGGFRVRSFGGFIFSVLLGLCLTSLGFWIQNRDRRALWVFVSMTWCLVIIAVFPDDALAGFLVTQDDPRFVLKYAPELSILGLALPFLLWITKAIVVRAHQRLVASVSVDTDSASPSGGLPSEKQPTADKPPAPKKRKKQRG